MKKDAKKVRTMGEIKTLIIPILKEHGIRRAGVFGSLARGERRKDSDIDIVVEIENDISLLEFIGIKQQLEEALDLKVDLVEYKAIKPRIKKQILKEEIPLL